MQKKIILIIICLFILFSCGKKGDPEYKTEINNILINQT